MNFELLVNSIQNTHSLLQQSAIKAINKHITIRNWLIGFYIIEYEQKGEDRAAYGENLLQKLSERLNKDGLSSRNLKLFRQFYQIYPQIRQTLTAQLQQFDLGVDQIRQTVSAQLMLSQIRQTTSPELQNIDNQVPPDKLISRLSFSHFSEMLEIKDSPKRTFYELECIKGNWSIRELRRQINSLYFERSGLSKNPEKLSIMVAENAEPIQPVDVMQKNDNFPVGILLVTNKNDALVQYATAGMDNNLFVSKYLVELPSKQQLEEFMKNELKKL